MNIEALKEAHDLSLDGRDFAARQIILDVIANFEKEALSEPEQEPVAWMNDSTPSGIFARHIDGARNFGCTIPLYTTPPQRKPLSEEEINEIAKNYALNNSTTPFHFARAIEAAHNIKE